MTTTQVFAVAVGGAVGSVLRHLVGSAVAQAWPAWGAGTLVVNVVGSFLLGLLLEVSGRSGLDPVARLALGTGLLGGFTTFSTFAWEVARPLGDGRPLLALAVVLAQVVGGVLAAAAGMVAARWLA